MRLKKILLGLCQLILYLRIISYTTIQTKLGWRYKCQCAKVKSNIFIENSSWFKTLVEASGFFYFWYMTSYKTFSDLVRYPTDHNFSLNPIKNLWYFSIFFLFSWNNSSCLTSNVLSVQRLHRFNPEGNLIKKFRSIII